MSRFFASVAVSLAVVAGLVLGPTSGCSSADLDELGLLGDAAPPRLDGAPVDPSEGGAPLDAGPKVTPSCERYCNLVMTNCTGDNAQYASTEECLAFCAFLPLEQPSREVEEKNAASVACRQYWADSPARTNPEAYCLAAGPFGGNVCGDRCTAFCGVLLGACAPDGGQPAYPDQPKCANACAMFSYRDAGADGGGETPHGPATGDTLNCRLFHLRAATQDPQSCKLLHPDGGACE